MKYLNLILGLMAIVTAIICVYQKSWTEFWCFFAIGCANIELFQLKDRKP